MAFADNCQMCMSKPLPSRGQVKSMGRAPFMDVSGMTSILGLAALNGSTDDAFIEASLWETNVYQVI